MSVNTFFVNRDTYGNQHIAAYTCNLYFSLNKENLFKMFLVIKTNLCKFELFSDKIVQICIQISLYSFQHETSVYGQQTIIVEIIQLFLLK